MAKVCKVDSILFKNKTQSKIEQNGFLFERSELSTHIKKRKCFKKNLLKKIGKKKHLTTFWKRFEKFDF